RCESMADASGFGHGDSEEALCAGGHAIVIGCKPVSDANGKRELQQEGGERDQWGRVGDIRWWQFEPDLGRVAHGVAARVDRLKAIGNGQVPQAAALAWRTLTEGI